MSSSNKVVVRVGVGVLIRDPLHPQKVFAGIRQNSHGANTLALPGGHLELYESWEQCATRETLEETGLQLRPQSVRFGHVTNDIMEKEGKHYVTIFMMGECQCEVTRPKNLEPHKCSGWESYSWDDLCRFAAASKDDGSSGGGDDDDDEIGEDVPKLFGPLLKLVEEMPPNVVRFLNER
jgi:8-oxo-dGTP diphosphatase